MAEETTLVKSNAVSTSTFGTKHTDHMFVAEYKNGSWNRGELKDFQKLSISPFALCFHYGQTVFEGMKAFQMNDGQVNIFRPEKHLERINVSLERMKMAELPRELFMNAITKVVQTDKDWFEKDEDRSLYIRPLVIASEERIGVKVSEEYLFIVMASPAGKYFVNPLNVKVETTYTRAFDGGTGFAKCGGNYGAAFYPTHLARQEGFDQVIWTDGINHEYIEESGAMNLMFVVDGTLMTPALSGTILDGITRDSLLAVAKQKGMKTEERKISVTELKQWFNQNKKVEAFGAGTAAVVAPIKTIDIGGNKYLPYIGDDAVMFTLKKELSDVKYGLKKD
ncbi:MAG: branched-chain amino acid aminotransferase, partial [Bacteroidia bacterium]|nr:branched-chain amino acid aminotransferase [Bacteroidia bacterium]